MSKNRYCTLDGKNRQYSNEPWRLEFLMVEISIHIILPACQIKLNATGFKFNIKCKYTTKIKFPKIETVARALNISNKPLPCALWAISQSFSASKAAKIVTHLQENRWWMLHI